MKAKNTISLYWKCQLAGWMAASLYWGYTAFLTSPLFDIREALADYILDVVVGILLTHGYRQWALWAGWNKLPLTKLVFKMIAAVLILSVLYMVCIIGKLYLVRKLLIEPGFKGSFSGHFYDPWLILFVTGTRLMSIWVLAYHLYHYAVREIQAARENARLQVVAKEAQLHNLYAQLNPHFFFNSLTNIKCLVKDDPQAARRAIDLLSDLLRHSLYEKSDILIPLQQEVDFVKDYLELEKLRFEERLQVQVIIDEQLAGVPIPPFCIQTLVENAIKHGIEKRKAGGLVEVLAAQHENGIIITVQNPGHLNKAGQAGLGLQNLQERLQLHYGGRAEFTIDELMNEKVIATIHFA